MSITVLIEGWIKYPHSYALVNVYQMLALKNNCDVKIILKEVEPYRSEWPVFCPLTDLVLTGDEQRQLDQIERWDGTQSVDVIYRISYPFDLRSSENEAPVILFYTAEFQRLRDDMFSHGTAKDFSDGGYTAVTPSVWSARAMPKKACVIPHGIDVTKYFPMKTDRFLFRKTYGVPEDAFVFLNVGAMTGNKNVMSIIKCLYRLSQIRDDVYLVLKGIGDMYICEEYINQMIKKLVTDGVISRDFWKSMKHKLIFIDSCFGYSDMCKLYNSADCYVSAYIAEGFNLPVLEAIACGLVVIVSKGGSTDDFVTLEFAKFPVTLPGVTDAGDHLLIIDDLSLQNVMLEVIDAREFRDTARKIGPEHIKNGHTWDIVSMKLYQILRLVARKTLRSNEYIV
jgi:glycosyltransferase involved in cell wall biosynthesis